MKMKFLLVCFLFVSAAASAQMNNQIEDYKPSAGDRSFEVNFAPFSSSPISLSYLKGRLFVEDDFAYRAGLSLAYTSQDPNSSFEFALAPGIESHFAGTERLSPYVGAEVILAGRFSSSSTEAGGGTIETSGAWADGSNRGFFSFGINGLIGVDYYVTRHLFLGFEAGYGLNYISNSQIQRTVDGDSDIVSESSSTFNIGPNFNSAIRLGFLF